MNYYEMLLARKLAKGELPPNAYLLKEASGSLVSFSDGADLPMPSFICNIDAVQDLHGYDSPWVGGAGKNKLPMTVDGIKAINTSGTWNDNVYTINDVTFTVMTDNGGNVIGIKANGTASANNTRLWIGYIEDGEPISGAKLSGTPTNDVNARITVQRNSSPWTTYGTDYGSEATISTIASGIEVQIFITIENATTLTNAIFYPMIRLATVTDTTFAPYSNLCPISGHTGVDAWVRGKNLVSAENKSNLGSGYIIGDSYTAVDVNIPVGTHTFSFNCSGTLGNLKSYNIIDFSSGSAVTLATGDLVIGENELTFTTDKPISKIKSYTNNTGTVNISDIQIEIGEKTTYEPYNPQSQTIQVSWQTEAGEVYGGYVDLVSGEMTVTHGIVNCKNLTFSTATSTGGLHWADITGSTTNIEPISNKLKYLSRGDDGWLSTIPCLSIRADDGRARVYGSLSDYEDGGTYENTLVVYPLATPITYQLTPQQIKSLLGNNNAWCDTGDVNIKYWGKGDA